MFVCSTGIDKSEPEPELESREFFLQNITLVPGYTCTGDTCSTVINRGDHQDSLKIGDSEGSIKRIK